MGTSMLSEGWPAKQGNTSGRPRRSEGGIFQERNWGDSNWTDLCCQRIKLVGERHRIGAIDLELALADHVHELDAGEHAAGAAERFEVEHWPGHPLDGAVVLLDDVVEVFDLAHHNRHVPAGVDRIDGRLVSAALVHGDLVGNTVLAHGLVEEAFCGSHVPLGGQKKIDGLSLLVDGTVKILPDAFDLDVGFVHAPAAADRAFVLAGQFLKQRQETNRPSVDRRMVDRHAALLHDLFQVPVAQRVSHIPANADQDHIDWETHPFEIEHVDSSSVRASQFTRSPCCLLTRHNRQAQGIRPTTARANACPKTTFWGLCTRPASNDEAGCQASACASSANRTAWRSARSQTRPRRRPSAAANVWQSSVFNPQLIEQSA